MYNVQKLAGDLQKVALVPRVVAATQNPTFLKRRKSGMFRVRPDKSQKAYRLAIVALLALSFLALLITIWVMVEFSREQVVLNELMEDLSSRATESAKQLAGELQWQFRLTALVVINSVVTFVTLILLWRAYRSSQDSLRDVRALAGDILSSVDQAVITTDVEGTITSINQRGIQMLALEEDYVGRSLRDLIALPGLDAFRSTTRESTSNALSRDFDYRDNGTDRTLRAQCQRLTDWQNADIGNVLQLRDITKRQLIEARMLRMERFMGLGSLAAGLHHEIKNPLAALSLHIQLLEEQLYPLETEPNTNEMVDVIKSELQRVNRVLEGFRDFTSLDRLDVADVNLAELVLHQTKLIEPRAAFQGVELRVHVPESLPKLRADYARFEQVLVNLFVNALDAMPDGGTLQVTAEETRIDGAPGISLKTSDSGSGIPADLQNDIFDPYFTTKHHGTGMGLAFCDKILRQHHGSIDVDSNASGTVFEITLPLDPKPESLR